MSWFDNIQIELRTAESKLLLRTNLLSISSGVFAALTLFSEIISGDIVFNALNFLTTKLPFFSNFEWKPETKKIVSVATYILASIVAIRFLLIDAIRFLIKSSWYGFGLNAKLALRNYQSFHWRKLFIDIKNSEVSSRRRMRKEIKSTISDVDRLEGLKKDENSWLNNSKLFSIKSADFNSTFVDKIVDLIEGDSRKLKKNYQIIINKLHEKRKNDNWPVGIKFNVASVQPAFYSIAADLRNDISKRSWRKNFKMESFFDVDSPTTTGPETVYECLHNERENSNYGYKNVQIFVAPLSAYLTSEYEEYEQPLDPNKYFNPIIPISVEDQIVYYIESGISLPKTKGNLFYLNNSTAEECVAALYKELDLRFNPKPINEIDEYLKILSGKTTNAGKIDSGDAAVLWTPLNYYFDNFSLGEIGFYNKISQVSSDSFKGEYKSKIVLFSTRFDLIDQPSTEVLQQVIKAYVLKIAIRNARMFDTIWPSKYLWRIQYWFKDIIEYHIAFRKSFKNLFPNE